MRFISSWLTVIVLLIGMFGCTTQANPTASPTPALPRDISNATREAVIVPSELGDTFIKSLTGLSAAGYWTPNDADITALEAQLADYLQTINAPRSPDLAQKSAAYKRQYIGFVRNNQQLIYANFMCDTFDESSWKTGPLIVMDG